MNNCLVTTLKAAVNDNSLLKIGEMLLKVGTSTQNYYKRINFTTYPQVIETLDGSLSLTNDENLLTGFTNKITLNFNDQRFYTKNQDVVIVVPNKYYVTEVLCNNTKINLNNLKYSSNLSKLENVICEGSIDNIKDKPITYLNGVAFENMQDTTTFSGFTALTFMSINNTSISGDISALSGLTKLTYLGLMSSSVSGDISALSGLTALNGFMMGNANVSGDISSLSGLTNLVNINLDQTYVSGNIENIGTLVKLTSLNICALKAGAIIRGEIIDFVSSQRSHGRTIGNIKIRANSNITFNGVPLNDLEYYNFSWTDSTITNKNTSETVDR